MHSKQGDYFKNWIGYEPNLFIVWRVKRCPIDEVQRKGYCSNSLKWPPPSLIQSNRHELYLKGYNKKSSADVHGFVEIREVYLTLTLKSNI